MVFFVNQKKHNSSTGNWDNNCAVKQTMEEAYHQFHAFMSTYGYGFGDSIDYCSCSVEAMDGCIYKSEVDDRMDQPEPEQE